MKQLLLVSILLLASAPAKAIDIQNCYGGIVMNFSGMYREAALRGESVRVLGHAQSACTMFFAHFPKEKICFGPNAKLGFHLAYDRNSSRANVGMSSLMLGSLPKDIQDWIEAHGGIKGKDPTFGADDFLWMGAKELWKLGYKRC